MKTKSQEAPKGPTPEATTQPVPSGEFRLITRRSIQMESLFRALSNHQDGDGLEEYNIISLSELGEELAKQQIKALDAIGAKGGAL